MNRSRLDIRKGKDASSLNKNMPTLDATGRSRALTSSISALPSVLQDWRILAGILVVLLSLGVAIFAPLIATHDPNEIGVAAFLLEPNSAHLMGTDDFGRDYFSRVVYGTQISTFVALSVAASAIVVGLPLGLVLGYVGGRLDFGVSRVLDLMFAFPGILSALVLVTILGPGVQTVIIALSIIYIPVVARFVRGVAAAERNLPYVMAIRVAGASHVRIMTRHILPNILSQVLVIGSLVMAFAVLAEAGLSFVGLGVQPPDASWGRLLTENRGYLSTATFLVVFPGIAITMLVLALSLLGDGLRDRFDPRQRLVKGRE